ncbi:MAG TPA: iron chelate uptake ABC transporter family permease subunit, partial [Rectinemataceae bacterium]
MRRSLAVLALGILVLAALLASLCLGSVPIKPSEVVAVLGEKLFGVDRGVDAVTVAIVWELRLARTLLAGVAGASLAAAGAVLQGLFRNPLADPYSMGVSSGASLGAVLAIVAGGKLGLGFAGSVEISAFAGALASALLVYGAARANKRVSPTAALLLAGAAVGAFVSAIVSLIVALNDKDLHTVFFWMLGGFGG